MAAIKIRWTVEELSNVLTQYDVQKVYRSTTVEAGPYSEITTVPTRVPLVADQYVYEYIDSAGDSAYFYKVAFFHSISLAESAMSGVLTASEPSGLYCSIQDMRDEGYNDPPYSDARILAKIKRASRWIERVTGRWFEPRAREFTLRARGGQKLFCPAPIIRLDSATIVYNRGEEFDETDLSLDELLVYNRHLTMGIENPDDRDVPIVSFPRDSRLWSGHSVGASVPHFPNAFQAVKIAGLFGYTDLESGVAPGETAPGSQVPTSYGVTPDDISQLTMILAGRDLPLLSDTDAREDERNKHRITGMKTREQSITMSPLSSTGQKGSWTGDPTIDEMIALFVEPPGMEMV